MVRIANGYSCSWSDRGTASSLASRCSRMLNICIRGSRMLGICSSSVNGSITRCVLISRNHYNGRLARHNPNCSISASCS